MNKSTEDFTPLARHEGLVVQKLADEVLVYDLERHLAHCLNPTAAAIWELCDGRTSVVQMVARIHASGQAAVDVETLRYGLRQLAKSRLLEDGLPEGMGLSRRQLLRRAGVVAAIGLPVVASVLAPTAAEAGTCVGLNGNCASLPCCVGCACISGMCMGACAP
ncbi:MAG: PqqD family protein [Candidatus Entotheonellia bacterium]